MKIYLVGGGGKSANDACLRLKANKLYSYFSIVNDKSAYDEWERVEDFFRRRCENILSDPDID